MEETTQEQPQNSKVPIQLQPHQFKKGQSGNPGGRPVGTISLKERAKQMIASMSDEEAQEYLHGIDKKTIWEMAEGKPKQDMDFKGEVISKVISLDD